jgi:hypothetical protein
VASFGQTTFAPPHTIQHSSIFAATILYPGLTIRCAAQSRESCGVLTLQFYRIWHGAEHCGVLGQ